MTQEYCVGAVNAGLVAWCALRDTRVFSSHEAGRLGGLRCEPVTVLEGAPVRIGSEAPAMRRAARWARTRPQALL